MINAHGTTGPLTIRAALPAEAAAVAELHRRARSTYYPNGLPDDGVDWHAVWRGAIDRPDGHVLCAVRDARLAAIASFRSPEGAPADTVKLFQFHVDPGQWRCRVGTALHAACVEQWQADGRRTAVLDVHVDNHRAQAFYARQGWFPDPENPPADGDHHLDLRYSVAGE
ncbi:GNAT family N-acetyltransferase [Streptomyces himalayensis]|uniref:GNAT family N-acetyltransferase n=1 Tax=Streptomyces himalayensis subsp. himalayensis TaxID=2756131 RepID=A0A7W0DPB8_9ACTN|nr:GNAT family N-acetyltransferase [Streptomyces himalayensis]MBA2948390.1 GNAT family N-acetyltransferase [Streptomyces himalayensis subsp. himalayensis]